MRESESLGVLTLVNSEAVTVDSGENKVNARRWRKKKAPTVYNYVNTESHFFPSFNEDVSSDGYRGFPSLPALASE